MLFERLICSCLTTLCSPVADYGLSWADSWAPHSGNVVLNGLSVGPQQQSLGGHQGAHQGGLQLGIQGAHQGGHQGGHQPLPARFQCPCGNLYRYERNLKMHLKRECGKEPSLACPHCPYRSKQKSHMKRHVRCKHGDLTTIL